MPQRNRAGRCDRLALCPCGQSQNPAGPRAAAYKSCLTSEGTQAEDAVRVWPWPSPAPAAPCAPNGHLGRVGMLALPPMHPLPSPIAGENRAQPPPDPAPGFSPAQASPEGFPLVLPRCGLTFTSPQGTSQTRCSLTWSCPVVPSPVPVPLEGACPPSWPPCGPPPGVQL